MRYKAVLGPEISRAIRAFGLDREAFLGLLNGLHSEIEEGRVDAYRYLPHRRNPGEPDRSFWLEFIVPDGEQHRAFRFVIDDAMAPDRMFVVDAREV